LEALMALSPLVGSFLLLLSDDPDNLSLVLLPSSLSPLQSSPLFVLL
jgi:hypothetical protein